jgi:glycosyltransferase involved in cell wall biosynthesis
MRPKVSIVVPVYNEAEAILPFYYELIKFIKDDFELIWIDDGSTDCTFSEIETLSYKDHRIRCISLKKNFGQTNAIIAGLDFAVGEYIIIMSGDLQHPPRYIPEIILQLNNGAEIVETQLTNTARTFFIQRKLLDVYYTFLKTISSATSEPDLREFRGFHHKILDDVRYLNGSQLFSKNVINWGGYKVDYLPYKNSLSLLHMNRYHILHLLKTTNTAIKNLLPGVLKSFIVLGTIVTAASGIISFVILRNMLKGLTVDTRVFLLVTVLFAGGIQLLIFSTYKKKLAREISKAFQKHQYLIKDIVEQKKEIHVYN